MPTSLRETMANQDRATVVARAQRAEFEAQQLKRALRVSQSQLLRAEALRETLFGLTHPALDIPRWVASPKQPKDSAHLPVLVAGDFHWGEQISRARLGGVNAYNITIAKERYRRLIERTIDISLTHLPKNRYTGIVYLRLGDMISGEIHEDQRETNEQHTVPAIRSLVEAETWGIKALAEAFGRVHVVSVPGNHPRTTPRPQSKRGFDNFDILSAWWLESLFKINPRVTFYAPESGDAVFTIYGRRYLATHGDKIGSRGGEGLVGPEATIVRGMKRVSDQYARLRQPLSRIFVGHFHVRREFGYGWSNGSLAGYSEYARDGRLTPEPPEQWLILFHRKYGATSRWPILLESEPKASPTSRQFEAVR